MENKSAQGRLSQGAIALWLAEQSLGKITAAWSWLAAVAGAALAAASLPFARTFDPALIIDDPAMMFALVGALVLAASHLLHERSTR